MTKNRRTAVILFNLGGPSDQDAVRPFLFNLFYDRAIIRLRNPWRWLLAQLISRRRKKTAQEIYQKMGGGSPILINTVAQAEALAKSLNAPGDGLFQCFISMRYWHPFADQTVKEVKMFEPDQIILLPLYPQYSTTTTASSLSDWARACEDHKLEKPTRTLCCYPVQSGFIEALAGTTRLAIDAAQSYGSPRVLFSAHGLPEKIIAEGDPYRIHCEMTVEALKRTLNIDGLDSFLCFQSRVGPLAWIKPATDDEVRRAGRDKVPLVIVPIAFTSDHSETLVELDIEYRKLAGDHGVPFYAVVPAVGAMPRFIDGLRELVRDALNQDKACVSDNGIRSCPSSVDVCPCKTS